MISCVALQIMLPFFLPMQSLGDAFKTAQELMTKKDGKTTFTVPTTGQVAKIVTSTGEFVSTLRDFVNFAQQKESQFPILKELPVKQSTVDKLVGDLEVVKRLPY